MEDTNNEFYHMKIKALKNDFIHDFSDTIPGWTELGQANQGVEGGLKVITFNSNDSASQCVAYITNKQ